MTSKLSALLLSFFLFVIPTNFVFSAGPGPNSNASQQTSSTLPSTSTTGGCTCSKDEVCTAIGCVSTKADASGGFFESILRIFVGMGGGLALILMLYGVFIVTTSAGIPDKLKEGSEIITSAIAGLIFILLSVVLLNLIGINILNLPGLS